LKLKNTLLFAVLLVGVFSGAGLGAARPVGALKPDQILVVASADSTASRELASFYVSQRGIPERNIVLVKTTEKYIVSREHYLKNIRKPIVQAMLERRLDKHIRCICLMWGVPVRISEASLNQTAAPGGVGAFYRAQATEALLKMSVYHKLLSTVGKTSPKVPDPPSDRIENVSDMFPGPMPAAPKTTPVVKTLLEQLRKSVVRKQIDVRFMSDKAGRLIAERQLMALHRELYGLKGLADYIRDTKILNPPAPAVLKERLEKIENGLGRLRRPGAPKTLADARTKVELMRQSGGLRLVVGYGFGPGVSAPKMTTKRAKTSKHLTKSTACLDNELALIWDDKYTISGQLPNPLHWRNPRAASKTRAVMTARIDAPSATLARRIITDSIAVEKTGLRGVFYIDSGLVARFAKNPKNLGYRIYDNRLKALHRFVSMRTKMKTVLDTSGSLFAPGKCPDAALYAGWYSLRKYVPAFTWKRGAVGWHTASFEAADLRNPKSSQWCPSMLSAGAAATVGAVDEPLLTAFPAPEEFYPLLLTGRFTLAECYWRTTPMVSWQITLIGDPLYNPFKANPQVSASLLPRGLAP